MSSWKHIGQQINLISDSSAWWLGDWLIYGQRRYPDYQRAVAETSLDCQTLRNYAWIARKFDASRRRDRLSLQHHVEVAALTEEEQDIWLSRAEEHGWSRNQLRRHLKAARTADPLRTPDSVATIEIQVALEKQRRWEQAARRVDCELSEWIVEKLNEAALLAGETHPDLNTRGGTGPVGPHPAPRFSAPRDEGAHRHPRGASRAWPLASLFLFESADLG